MEEEAQPAPPTQVRATIQRNHPVDQILGDISKGVTTRSRLVNFCEHYSFVSSIEPFRVEEALLDPDWVLAMQEELNNFKRNEVWTLVPRPKQNVVGTKWVFRNKQDEHGVVSMFRDRPGGSLDRRVNCRRVPQPRWVGARRSAKGGGSRRETGVRGGIPRPSCLSRAQVGCACSRGLQASTWEGASGLTRAPSRRSPCGPPSVRGPWSFLL
jgi:hypothetical protein